MLYSEEEQRKIIQMCDKFLEMTPQEIEYIYQNSRGQILGIEIAYDMAKEILHLRSITKMYSP